MSQENVERARQAYEALGLAVRAGDFDAFFRDFVHPEIEPLEGALDTAIASGHGPVKARFIAMPLVIEFPPFLDRAG